MVLNTVNQMWNEGSTQAQTQYLNDNTTAKALLGKQNIRYQEVLNRDGKCIDLKLWMPDLSEAAGEVLYSGTVVNPSADCDLLATKEIGSRSFTYNPNVFITDGITVSDDLCDNEFAFAQQQAIAITQLMRNMRFKFNKRCILHLDSSASTNLDTLFVGDEFTADGVSVSIPRDSWKSEDILGKMQIMAAANKIPSDFLILDGTNLLLNTIMAPYKGLNDAERSNGALYRTISGSYFSDLLGMNATLGEQATFLQNPNMFGFYNNSAYSSTPTIVDASRNRQAISIPDPELTYARTMISPDGGIMRETVPVTYDFYYEYACLGRNAQGRLTYQHKWEANLLAAILLGPTSQSGLGANTNGTLKFVKLGV